MKKSPIVEFGTSGLGAYLGYHVGSLMLGQGSLGGVIGALLGGALIAGRVRAARRPGSR